MNQRSNFKSGAKRQATTSFNGNAGRYKDRLRDADGSQGYWEVADMLRSGRRSGPASCIGWTDAKKVPGVLFAAARGVYAMTPAERAIAQVTFRVDVATKYWFGDVDKNEVTSRKLFDLFAEKADSWEGFLDAVEAYEEWYKVWDKAGRPEEVPAAVEDSTETLAELSQQYPGISLVDAMAIIKARQGTTPAAPAKMTAREKYQKAVEDAAKANG